MRRIDPYQLRVLPEDVLHAQGADPEILRDRRPVLWEQVCEAIAIGQQVIQPVVWLKVFPVIAVRHNRVDLGDAQKLTGELVAEHLAGADRVAIGITTMGSNLDREIQIRMDQDVSFGFLLDSYGSVAAEKLALQVQEEIATEACAGGAKVSMSLSPGLIGWPVDQGQPQIFQALQPDPRSIHLTPFAQIIPRKSCSFVIGIGDDLAQGVPCDYCAVRDTCLQRNSRHACQ